VSAESNAIRAELQQVLDSGGSALEFLLLKFQAKSQDKTSEYFLPVLLSTVSNPQIFPSLTVDHWDFNLTGDAGSQVAKNICAATAPFLENQIPTSSSAYPAITLGTSQYFAGKVDVLGLIDASLGTPTVSGPNNDVVNAAIQFGAYTTKDKLPDSVTPGIPPDGSALVLSGTFTLNQSCCLTEDLTTCLPNSQNNQIGWGNFTMTFGSKTTAGAPNVTGSAVAQVLVASMQPPQVAIKVSQILLTVSDLDQVKTTVQITSIGDHQKEWNEQAEKALNDPSAKNNIIANVNAVLGSPNNLTAIQTLLQDQMNAYLKKLFG